MRKGGKYSGNISLIGMAGCGKSTNGVVLAKALNLAFVDTDLIIQRRNGGTLTELIERYGTERFIEIEAEAVMSLEVSSSCIATGGSVVYSDPAMKRLKSISRVVYIELPFSEISRRVSNIKSRGIVIEDGKTLEDIYVERRPLYEKYADITVQALGNTIERTVEEIISRL